MSASMFTWLLASCETTMIPRSRARFRVASSASGEFGTTVIAVGFCASRSWTILTCFSGLASSAPVCVASMPVCVANSLTPTSIRSNQPTPTILTTLTSRMSALATVVFWLPPETTPLPHAASVRAAAVTPASTPILRITLPHDEALGDVVVRPWCGSPQCGEVARLCCSSLHVSSTARADVGLTMHANVQKVKDLRGVARYGTNIRAFWGMIGCTTPHGASMTGAGPSPTKEVGPLGKQRREEILRRVHLHGYVSARQLA